MKNRLVVAAAIALVPLLLFLHTTQFEFVRWDDDIDIYENPHIRTLDGGSLRWMFTDTSYALRYMPLTWLSWAATYQFAGADPFWYHLGNVILHAIASGLLFLLIAALLDAPKTPPTRTPRFARDDTHAGGAAPTAAAIAALMWACHPLRAEVVSWSTARSYSLCAVFLFASFLLYFRFARDGRGTTYTAAVLAYALSLMSYTPAAGAAPLFLIADWHPLGRRLTERRVWLEKIPFLLLGAVTVVITGRARRAAAGIWAGWVPLEEFGIVERAAQAFYTWIWYLRAFALPPALSPMYPRLIDFRPEEPVFILSAAAFVVLTAAALLVRRRYPAFTALWLSYVIVLVPALGLTERPHFTSDRYAHIPQALLVIGVAAVLFAARRRAREVRMVAATAAMVVLALFAWRAHLETLKWRNSFTLMHSMLEQLQGQPIAANVWFRLGTVYLEKQRPAEAVAAFEEALRLRPDDPRIPPLIELARRASTARPDARTAPPGSGKATGTPPAPAPASPR